MTKQLQVTHGANFSVAHAGNWKDMFQHAFPHPLLGKVPGKLFLKELLGLTALEVSLGALPPGRGTPFLHAHKQNEELYIFIKGRGEMLVDGQVVEVREGSVIRVAPEGARAWRNTSQEDLHYIVVQARAGTLENGTISDGREVAGAPDWQSSKTA